MPITVTLTLPDQNAWLPLQLATVMLLERRFVAARRQVARARGRSRWRLAAAAARIEEQLAAIVGASVSPVPTRHTGAPVPNLRTGMVAPHRDRSVRPQLQVISARASVRP